MGAAGWIIAILEAALLVSAWVRIWAIEGRHNRKCAKCSRDVKAIMSAQEAVEKGWTPFNASQRAARGKHA